MYDRYIDNIGLKNTSALTPGHSRSAIDSKVHICDRGIPEIGVTSDSPPLSLHQSQTSNLIQVDPIPTRAEITRAC